jgi:two-component system chemotaxis response regulator CheY
MASILAVDDSASMRQMVSFTLKGAGNAVYFSINPMYLLKLLAF